MTLIPFEVPFNPKAAKKPAKLVHHVPSAQELQEHDSGKAALDAYLQSHGVAATLTAALNELAALRPADPIAALAAILAQKRPVASSGDASSGDAASASDGKLDEAALMKLSVEERAAYERKHVKKGGGGIEFDPTEVAEDGGDATLDDFFGALGLSAGDGGPVADDDDADGGKGVASASDSKLDEAALMKLSVEERAAYERKHVKKGGGGIEFDPTEVAEDGGDATLDDFLGALM